MEDVSDSAEVPDTRLRLFTLLSVMAISLVGSKVD